MTAIAKILTLSVLGLNPVQAEPLRESVDVLEINHYFDDHGRLVFDQAIFYQWDDRESRYMVLAWRLIKHPSQLPVRDFQGGGWLSVWHDGEVVRHVRAESVRETWTQYDPELVERETLPQEQRRQLRASPVKPSNPHPGNQNSNPAPNNRPQPNQER